MEMGMVRVFPQSFFGSSRCRRHFSCVAAIDREGIAEADVVAVVSGFGNHDVRGPGQKMSSAGGMKYTICVVPPLC